MRRYFNSRSCEGATGEVLEILALGDISTHAPVKERLPLRVEKIYIDEFQLTLL